MEMTEGIYRPVDPDEVSRPSTDKYEEAGADTIDLSKTPDLKDNQDGPGPHHCGPWKSTAVFLGLLCVLLLSGIAVLIFKVMETKQSQASCTEKLQMQSDYDNLIKDKLTLQESYDNLNREKFQLQTSYNTLNSEKSKLQDRVNNLTKYNTELQTGYNSLNKQRALLETSCNNVTEEKSKLQGNYNNLFNEKSQLQDRLDTVIAERDALQNPRMQMTQYAVDVTLDPDTAHPNLILSADKKQVKYGTTAKRYTENSKRFSKWYNVLGKQGFSSGRFYYEVNVSGKTEWSLGVARESTDRKSEKAMSPVSGYWIIMMKDVNDYVAQAGPNVPLSLKGSPERVGVFVDYAGGLVSFYDAGRWNLIYSYSGVVFSDKIYPVLNPHQTTARNSAQLILISPVNCVT